MKHDHGNDGPAMPASVAHRGRDPFDRGHEGDERGGGHQHLLDHDDHHHHQSPVNAPDPQDGLVAVVGGSAIAAGEGTAVTGFVENFAEDMGRYSIAMGEAVFQASAYSSEPGGALAAAGTFLDVSGADFIFERETDQAKQGLHDAAARAELDYFSIDIHGWSPPYGPIVVELDQSFGHHQPFGHDPSYGNFTQVIAMAEAHGANTLSATLTTALTIENQFSFVHGMAMVAL
ncbi:MAG: hypothetical protein ACXWLB_01590 [Reyranella sp.]